MRYNKTKGESKGRLARALAVWSFLAIVALLGAGCAADPPAAFRCNEDADQFYDFRTETCIKPSSAEQRYVLVMYSRLSRMAAEDPERIFVYQVGFQKHLSESEYTKIIAAPAVSSVDVVFLRFNNVTPPITVGEPIPSMVGKADALNWSMLNAVAMYKKVGLTPLAQKLEEAMGTDAFDVRGARIVMRGADAPAWWKAQQDNVRVIQPLANVVDHVQLLWEPEKAMP